VKGHFGELLLLVDEQEHAGGNDRGVILGALSNPGIEEADPEELPEAEPLLPDPLADCFNLNPDCIFLLDV
jgi:hypothetical protein